MLGIFLSFYVAFNNYHRVILIKPQLFESFTSLGVINDMLIPIESVDGVWMECVS